jgi:hypothetical protein
MATFTVRYEARVVGSLGWSREVGGNYSTLEVEADTEEQAFEAFDKQRATWYDRLEHIHVHSIRRS